MKFDYIDKTNKISDDDIIQDVLCVKNNILKKDTITTREYFLHGKYGKKAITNHFGTWNNLLTKLNIPITRAYTHLTKEDIFGIIEKLWLQLGKQPTIREFESMTNHTDKIILSNFGKWTKCLQEFVTWENNKNNKEIIQTINTNLHHKTPRFPSPGLRNDVMKRDHYKCVKCGRSPATDPTIILVIDHKKAYSKGGETTIDNLQTLCSECNLGKSNKED